MPDVTELVLELEFEIKNADDRAYCLNCNNTWLPVQAGAISY